MPRAKKHLDVVQVQVRMPAALKQQLSDQAKEERKSVNDCAVAAIEFWVGREEGAPEPVPDYVTGPTLDPAIVPRIMEAQAAFIAERGIQPCNLILGTAAWIELRGDMPEPPDGTVPECLGMDVVLGLPVPENHVSVYGVIEQAAAHGGAGDPRPGDSAPRHETPSRPLDAWASQLQVLQLLPREDAGRVFAALMGDRFKTLPPEFKGWDMAAKAAWLDANAPLEGR